MQMEFQEKNKLLLFSASLGQQEWWTFYQNIYQ